MQLDNLQQALAQVREVRQRVVESQRFRGYSGRTRAYCGISALVGAAVMAQPFFPRTSLAHLCGWGLVFLIAFAGNYGALLAWYWSEPGERRDWRQLLPAVDPLPPILFGGVATLAMIQSGHLEHLFGLWMGLFGLANLASRWVLPRGIWWVGLYYLLAGALCLLWGGEFLNPWPMGLVFGFGEGAGGLLFYFNQRPHATLRDFFLLSDSAPRLSE